MLLVANCPSILLISILTWEFKLRVGWSQSNSCLVVLTLLRICFFLRAFEQTKYTNKSWSFASELKVIGEEISSRAWRSSFDDKSDLIL